MRHRPKIRSFQAAVTVINVLLFLGLLYPAGAGALARGYASSDMGLQTGMVVALTLDSSSSESVERATQDNSTRVVGIVTTADNSLITVSSSGAKVLVENEGQVDAYVSDINGLIKQGDSLVISPLKGILMKNNANTPASVIAIAGGTSEDTTPYSYDDNGQTKQTKIIKIKVNLNHAGGASGTVVSDSVLARIGRSLAGRDIGETRVVIAMILFFVVLIAEGGVLYGAISSALTALGRNPLASKIIRVEMVRVVAVAIFVLLIGLAAVYGVLRI